MPDETNPQSAKKKILNLVGRSNYQPLTISELSTKLKLKLPETALAEILKELELAGELARIRHDRWVKPEDAQLITGVLHFNQKGFGFLISDHSEEDIYIAAGDTGTALHQDVVVVRLKAGKKKGRGDRTSGTVIRVLKRRRTTFIGTLQSTSRFHYVIPDDSRYPENIYVPKPPPQQPPYEDGDKVVVKFINWDNPHNMLEGELFERLGKAGDPGVDILSIIRKHELPDQFPSEALAQLADFPEPGGNAHDPTDTKRRDFRQDLIITIDPATARDFDDAIHVKKLDSGRWEVGVHIADVAHYVRPGSHLDREARARGNSVYLVDQVIPMLPEELSNGLCSLNPHVDRLTFSVIAEVNQHGEWTKPRVTRSIIHSKKRFSYEEALDLLKQKVDPNDPIHSMLHEAWQAASSLRAARMKKGSLDLDMPEVKVILDEQNRPVSIKKVEHDISHQLIEEFMLMANEVVAVYLTRKKLPAVFRAHEPPDPAKLEAYRELLKLHHVKVGNLENKKEVQKALRLIQEVPEAYALKVGFLRSMKKADYRTKCIGHYGLGKNFYTHFTSPIRRYADLVVHRALADRVDLPSPEQLKQIAVHISETERNASEAEIESIKLKKLQFFQEQANTDQPTPFSAIIIDVQNYGIFVELPDALMSGLVHISSLTDDFYDYEEREQCIRGRKSKKVFSMGDVVEVVVDRIDMIRQQIDFKIVGMQKRKSSSKGGRAHSRPGGKPRPKNKSSQSRRKRR